MSARPGFEALAERLADRLARDGYAVAPGMIDAGLCAELAAEACALANDPAAIEAGVGRGTGRTTDRAIRQAHIRWLDGSTPAQRRFLAEAQALQSALNRTLFLGLRSFEAQLALTPAGGFYRRHLDSFAGARNRIVSLVAYLAADWQPADGGALRLWPCGDETGGWIEVAPMAGTLLLMRSEDVAHEVMVCNKPRPSLAGWFRLREGREEMPGLA